MKTLSKKNLLVVFLSFVFALSMVAFASTVKPVKAEGEEESVVVTHNLVVQEEASLRIGLKPEEYSGIRFRVKVDDATKNAVVAGTSTLGFLITPKYYFDEVTKGQENLKAIQYLTELKKYDAEGNKTEDSAYVGTDGVGIIVKGTEGQPIEKKFYEAGKGFWYANAAVEKIKGENLNLEFTMVAYIKTGETVEYFLPATDFSRAYLSTANKSYINGEFELGIVRQSKDTNLQSFATENNPVEIVDGEDLYAISENVNNENTVANFYSDAHFVLVNDVTVGYGFEQIGSKFAGVLDVNGKSITVTNNRSLERVFENTNIEIETEIDQSLFSVDKFATNAVYYTTDSKKQYPTFVENAGQLEGFENPHDGDALKFKLGINGPEIVFKPNYTKAEVEAMKADESNKNLGVKFTYMGAGIDPKKQRYC